MSTKLVNQKVLKALTNEELLEKHSEYTQLGKIEGNGHFYAVAGEYLREYNSRTL